MKNPVRNLVAGLLVTLLTTTAHALPTAANVPGGVALVKLGSVSTTSTPPRAWLGKQPVWVTADNGEWLAVVGIALDTPTGTHELRVQTNNSERSEAFTVKAKDYPEQRITLKDSSKVMLAPVAEARALAEIERIQALKRHWRETAQPTDTDADFRLPAKGRLASRFGLRRIFNGEPRAPHSGLDVAVPRGTPIHASAGGTVLNVGDYFFNGKTVFIDHGNGLISMYCHLDRIDVREGDSIRQDQTLGLAGMTGRASGPHLHWSVVLNGVMVDPALFIVGKR